MLFKWVSYSHTFPFSGMAPTFASALTDPPPYSLFLTFRFCRMTPVSLHVALPCYSWFHPLLRLGSTLMTPQPPFFLFKWVSYSHSSFLWHGSLCFGFWKAFQLGSISVSAHCIFLTVLALVPCISIFSGFYLTVSHAPRCRVENAPRSPRNHPPHPTWTKGNSICIIKPRWQNRLATPSE